MGSLNQTLPRSLLFFITVLLSKEPFAHEELQTWGKKEEIIMTLKETYEVPLFVKYL